MCEKAREDRARHHNFTSKQLCFRDQVDSELGKGVCKSLKIEMKCAQGVPVRVNVKVPVKVVFNRESQLLWRLKKLGSFLQIHNIFGIFCLTIYAFYQSYNYSPLQLSVILWNIWAPVPLKENQSTRVRCVVFIYVLFK